MRDPFVMTVPIADLRPTQLTVGMQEVREKRRHWRSQRKKSDFLSSHVIPVVHGFKDRFYIIDHHHLARALLEEKVERVSITVVADLRGLDRSAFWTFLDHKSWTHPYDAKGERRPYRALPRSVAGLEDDPYRSLAGELRRAGGFAKDTTPFSEFLWADFLRRQIARKSIENNFAKALRTALRLSKTSDAEYLPGWCGPHKFG